MPRCLVVILTAATNSPRELFVSLILLNLFDHENNQETFENYSYLGLKPTEFKFLR